MLGILLIPSATFAQTSLEKLKQQRHEKILEIRKIAQEITDAYRSIVKMTESYRKSLYHCVYERLEKMEHPISEDEMRAIIRKEDKAALNHMDGALTGKHALDSSVIDNLFHDESSDPFCAHTFLEINSLVDLLFIKEALQRYKQILIELVIITQQVNTLQQEKNHA